MNMTLIGSAGALAVCSIAGSYWLVFGATIVFFMLTSILRPAINTLISKMAGDEQGFAAGMNNAFMSLANIVGPTVAGLLFDVNVEIPYILVWSFSCSAFWRQSAGGGSSRRAQFLKKYKGAGTYAGFFMVKCSNHQICRRGFTSSDCRGEGISHNPSSI